MAEQGRAMSAKDMKNDFVKKFEAVRSEELSRYELELLEFLKARSIDLSSRVIINEHGKRSHEIFIVDKL